MAPRRVPGIIRPKISTMPRNQSEASSQLELYKLVTEKQRLQQELSLVEQRTQQINQRINTINNQIVDTEKKIQEMRGDMSKAAQEPIAQNSQSNGSKAKDFNTFYLEY